MYTSSNLVGLILLTGTAALGNTVTVFPKQAVSAGRQPQKSGVEPMSNSFCCVDFSMSLA